MRCSIRRRDFIDGFGCAVAALLILLVLLPYTPPAGAAEAYRLDGGNTQVTLAVRLFGVPWLSARFLRLTGQLVPGPDRPPRVDVTIRTDSLHCDSAFWNSRLLAADWFDAARYPQISYHSDRIVSDAAGTVVEGVLSLRGRAHRLQLKVQRWTCGTRDGSDDHCDFVALGHVRRSDYGLPHGLFEGGDDVEISIHGVGAALR